MELTEIPEGWTNLHWKQQVALATDICEDRGQPDKAPKNGAEARAIINGEINRRMQDETMRSRSVDQPEIPAGEKTIPIILHRDTWLGEQRVRAEGKPVDWPLKEAKKLLDAKVAERADPLPGDEE